MTLTLTADVQAGTTLLPVSDPTEAAIDDVLKVGSELVVVRGATSATGKLLVGRGFLGSARSAHASGVELTQFALEAGSSFVGCRYTIDDGGSQATVLAGFRNVVPNLLGGVVHDVGGFLVDDEVTAPLSGFYRVDVGGLFGVDVTPPTYVGFLIGSNEAEPFVDDDDVLKVPFLAPFVRVQATRAAQWFDAGETIYVQTISDQAFNFQGAVTMTYLGGGTDPDLP